MQLNTGRYLEAYALMTLVFCGTVQYFTGIAAVLWLPFFLVLVMAVLLLMQSRPQPLAHRAGKANTGAVSDLYPTRAGLNGTTVRGRHRHRRL